LAENFNGLGLSEKVTQAVIAAGYTKPTEIQEQAIPHVLEKRDVIGIAQTGTGKTASFVLPMLTLLEKGRARARMPRTLILEPTRELAAQVHENFEKYGINHRLTVALLIGGVSFEDQNRKLDRGADVLIATPGRLLDHFERGRLLMTGVDVLVIDEADRMLDMGFIPDIERICSLLPSRRQTLFFSATMPPEIRKLTAQFLRDPVEIQVTRQNSTSENIDQQLLRVDGKPAEKRAALRDRIRASGEIPNAIIFCNRKRDVATLARSLERHKFNAGALHGDMDQKSRMDTLARFRTGELTFLVASDVAARGLDIPAVSHVFNFDVPTHAEDYVHRIGRTGRAGRKGQAVTLVSPSEKKYLDAIQKLTGRTLPWLGEESAVKTPLENAEVPPVAARQDGETGSRRSRSRRKPRTSGDRPQERVEEKAAQETGNPIQAERPAGTAREERSADRPNRQKKPQNKSGQSSVKDDTPFNDGPVPAFLLRPVSRAG
jgi:superfamily II DNA/RNA helicase